MIRDSPAVCFTDAPQPLCHGANDVIIFGFLSTGPGRLLETDPVFTCSTIVAERCSKANDRGAMEP